MRSYGYQRIRRAGTTSLECLVAFTLLGTVLALATPAIVAHSKLLKAQRDYRLALDELSSQLDRLGAVPAADLPPALEQLAPSDFAKEKLPGAQLRGELAAAEMGQRLTLELWWDEPNRRAAPVRLAGWIAASAKPSQE